MPAPKPSITFQIMRNRKHFAEVTAMMSRLYTEDPSHHSPNRRSFPKTLRILLTNPKRGRAILMKRNNQLAGYALLIPFWSNEFGGTLLFIDELFVLPQHRNHGIATKFLSHLTRHPPFNAIALALEVTPTNRKARRLYRSLGFIPRKNQLLVLNRPPSQ